jgi:hypothetical protein
VPQGETLKQYTINTRAVRSERAEAELDDEIKALEAAKNGKILDENGNELTVEDSVQKQIKALEKRVSDTKSYFQKRENDLVKQVDTLQTQLLDATKKQIKFPKTEEEVTEWVAKYPDVAAIVETIAMKKVQEVRSELDEQKNTLAEQKYEVEFNKQMNRIVTAHNDFADLQGDEDFVEWVQKQPKNIRSVFDTDIPIPYGDLEDAADTAIYAISLFKELNKKAAKKQPDNRDAARSVLNRNNAPVLNLDKRADLVYESDIEKLTSRQYTDEIDAMVNKAMSEGRFVYDGQSAAAR